MVPFVVVGFAAYDAGFGQGVGARVVLEVVGVRVELPCDEDVVVLQDLRYHVGVQTPCDVAHHVVDIHGRLYEIVAPGCPLGEGGHIVRHGNGHVFNDLRKRHGEVPQLRRQSGGGDDRIVDGSRLRGHEDRVNDSGRLLGCAQEILPGHLGLKDLGQDPCAQRRGFCRFRLRPFDGCIHGVGSAFSGQGFAPAAGAEDAESEGQDAKHDLESKREGTFDLLKGERVVPDHRRRVVVSVLHGGVVGPGPGGVVVDVPRDIEIEGLVDAGEASDVRLGAVEVCGQVGAVRVPVPYEVVETVGEADVQIVGAVIGVLAPPPYHVGCDVEVFDATVAVGGAIDPWVAGTGGQGTAVGDFFLDVDGLCLVDDGLDVEIGRRAAICRAVEFAV